MPEGQREHKHSRRHGHRSGTRREEDPDAKALEEIKKLKEAIMKARDKACLQEFQDSYAELNNYVEKMEKELRNTDEQPSSSEPSLPANSRLLTTLERENNMK